MKKTMFYTAIFVSTLFTLTLFQAACTRKTIPPNPNEEELITTIQLSFVDSAGIQAPFIATYRDIDGDGGNNPSVFDTIRLHPQTTYYTTIRLLDESKTPADTISNEVLAEGSEHLFCFSPSGIPVSVSLTDADAQLKPIGLQSKWICGSASLGNMRIQLRHQPDGIKDGTCAPGASDIDLTFVTLIQ